MSNFFQVNDLAEASESYRTLNNVLDFDAQNDTVRTPGSLSRNLRRVRQGLDLVRALFQNFLSSEYVESCCYTSLFENLIALSLSQNFGLDTFLLYKSSDALTMVENNFGFVTFDQEGHPGSFE